MARTDAREPDDNARTLGSILTDLGQEILSVVAAPRGLDVEVGMPMLFDQLEQSSVQPGDIVLGVGIAARPREAVGFIEEAGASGAAAVVLKLANEAASELVEASARTGVALLASPPAITWGQLYTLLRVAGGAAVASGPLVDGVPMGDLFALANAVAAMVGGAVTIEDPQSYVLAYSSSDLPIDEARREVILGRRVPERFLRRLREAGVFHRLQTSDDVVNYVDQEEELIPRLAVGIRAGGELLGSIWVAAATDPLDADTRTALQEAARMAALHLIRDRSTWDLERRQRGELVRTLLDGEVPPDAAPQLGLDADTAVTVVALRIEDVDDRHALSADLVARIERVAGLVALYFQSFHRRVAQVTIGRTIYVLVPESKPGERERLLRLVGDLVERARATVQTGIVASAGSTVPVDRRDQLVTARGRPGDSRPRVATGALAGTDRGGARRHDPAHAARLRTRRPVPARRPRRRAAAARPALRHRLRRDAVGVLQRLRVRPAGGEADLRPSQHVPLPAASVGRDLRARPRRSGRTARRRAPAAHRR